MPHLSNVPCTQTPLHHPFLLPPLGRIPFPPPLARTPTFHHPLHPPLLFATPCTRHFLPSSLALTPSCCHSWYRLLSTAPCTRHSLLPPLALATPCYHPLHSRTLPTAPCTHPSFLPPLTLILFPPSLALTPPSHYSLGLTASTVITIRQRYLSSSELLPPCLIPVYRPLHR